MFADLEIVGIARIGLDYALHFSNGDVGVIAPEELEQMLGYDISRLALVESCGYVN